MQVQDKKEKKRNLYYYLCWTGLGFSIYIVCFPIISKLLEGISPYLTQCPYLAMTGNPCPLCGGTRYIAGILKVFQDISYLWQPFGIMLLFVFFEMIWRIFILVKIKKDRNWNRYLPIDIVIHILAVLAFLAYEITFFLQYM